MSSRVFVPFDNNPTSVSVKTESYTIPAGKYAKVKNLCGNFSINGTLMGRYMYDYGSVVVNNTSTSRSQSGNTLKYTYIKTVSTGTSSTGSANYGYSIGAQVFYAPSTSINRNSFSFEINFNSSYRDYSYASFWNETGSQSFTITSDFAITCDEFELWLPAGTVISGSHFIVTEYNAVT